MQSATTFKKAPKQIIPVRTGKGFDIDQYYDDLKEQNIYAAELRKVLPAYVFKPVPQRLIWAAVHYSIVTVSVIAILNIDAWYADLFFALLMGHSLGCAFFLGHEVAHGSVVKNKKWITLAAAVVLAVTSLPVTAFAEKKDSTDDKMLTKTTLNSAENL